MHRVCEDTDDANAVGMLRAGRTGPADQVGKDQGGRPEGAEMARQRRMPPLQKHLPTCFLQKRQLVGWVPVAHMAREEVRSRSAGCTREGKKGEGLSSTGKLRG